MKIDNCRSCGALVIWLPVRDPKPGKKNIQIVNIESVIGIYILDNLRKYWKLLISELETPFYDSTKHVSHFATCPDAQAWRGKKK